MRTINAFLVGQNVDVGRTCSVLTLASAIGSFFGMLGQWMSGQFTVDLSLPVGAFVGIALWQHVSWARKLLIGLSWLVVAAGVLLLAAIPFTGTARLSLTVGSTVIQHPPLWQPYVFAVFAAPLAWFSLCVLHSEKARAEFQEQEQTPEPDAIIRLPPAPSDSDHGTNIDGR
jgi:hypothetical protein